jgi:mannose-6-phosphate isomerase-like protein (cupin superfamily)
MRPKPLAFILIAASSGLLFAQAPSPAGPAGSGQPRSGVPATQGGGAAPAQPPPPVRVARPAQAPTLTVTIQVVDGSGLPLANVQVTGQGPLPREGTTGADGAVRFTNMRPGTYRLRFVREGSITLERDIVVRAGEPLLVDVTLSAAPVVAKPEAVKPPAPESSLTALGPPGDPKFTPIPTFLEKNIITGREGRKESSLGCTSTGTATLYQLREAWLNHEHDDADEWLYVVAGEGTLRIGTADQHLQAGTFSLVPHTLQHAILPGGRTPLIVVSILTGPACGTAAQPSSPPAR